MASKTGHDAHSQQIANSRDRVFYFTTLCRAGVSVLVGTASEIENVNQVFQPDGRLAAANSPYPFRPKNA